MFKTGKLKLILVFSLTMIFVWMLFSVPSVHGQPNPFSEIQGKLVGVSDEEQQVLQKLFILVQETEEMEREEAGINRQIENINEGIKGLEKAITSEEKDYESKREILKGVLRSYQRRGPGSYLEIILNSESLTDFLRRLNALRDLTRNTGELLQSLEADKEKLAAEKTKLAAKLGLLADEQLQLQQSLAKKNQIKIDKEKYLASLTEKREYYQSYLDQIQGEWNELKPFFAETLQGASLIIDDLQVKLPADALKITFSFSKINAAIDEAAFNQVTSAYLPEMAFIFQPGSIAVRLPKKNLVLTGTLVIVDGHTVKFQAETGSFYGLPLEKSAIAELFRKGDLVFNFQPLVGGNILNSINIQQGYLEMELRRTSF